MDFFGQLIRLKIIPFIKEWRLINIILGAIDIFAIALAFQIAWYLNYLFIGGFFFTEKTYLILFIAILPLWLIVLYLLKVTEIPRTKRYRTLFAEYLQSAVIVAGILLIFYFIFQNYNLSRRFLIEFTFLGFSFLFLIRLTEYKVFKLYREQGFNYVNLVLMADEGSIDFIERLRSYPEWGYRIVMILTNSGKLNELYRGKLDILPEKLGEVLYDLMEEESIDEILYVKTKITPSEVREAIRLSEELGITFRLKTDGKQPSLTNAFVTDLAYEKFLTFINVPYKSAAVTTKKILDILISGILLILLAPVMIIIGIIIFITSKGPVIYKQTRVGFRGRNFDLYKFRTMIRGADELRDELGNLNEADGPVFKMRNDPRITKFGRFLRRSGLDELPQLVNVFKGEMSLIGPRPPLPEETKRYKKWQIRRLSVKPGLSCFWQIKPDRNAILFEKWMEMDLAYIDNWSLRLDFIILLKTIKTVFKRTGL
ncbi:MAG TPA: exopolysaccharide biosynthesis polyprenyl glycosylphosphotransferase [Bacteroidales bacterium]|nr:exopolysaccharide biosynthesis polyprenyl glycosylphosphotransferase [Bacteroidales bacterium]